MHTNDLAKRANSAARLFGLLILAILYLGTTSIQAQTCTLASKTRASDNPFASCPPGTDTIIITDTLEIDISYEPIIGGAPFEGELIVENTVLYWSANAILRLGTDARIQLCNGGRIYPGKATDTGCGAFKTIFFDGAGLASCDGVNASHSFSAVNTAGCLDGTGLCANTCMVMSSTWPVGDGTDVFIFPNPAQSVLYFETTDTDCEFFQLISLSGNIVAQGMLQDHKVDISNVAPGIYVLKLIGQATQVIKRVIKT